MSLLTRAATSWQSPHLAAIAVATAAFLIRADLGAYLQGVIA